ncbi:MAG: S41 family peptidase [Candidatus Woesebacteria bacterium]
MNIKLPAFTKKRFKISTLVLCVVIFSVVSFVLGTRADSIIAYVVNSQNKDMVSDLDYSGVEEIYDKLRLKYDGKLDANALLEGAKKGLVEAAGDDYTVYFNAEESSEFMSDLEGTFTGIGAELDKKDDQLTIVSTLDDSPAKKSGLMANDKIAKVNDQDTTDWSIEKAVAEIRGEKGTTVKLTVVRDQDLKEFSIVRDSIVNPSVRWEISDGIGYMRISRFAESNTIQLATQAASEFESKNVKGVVLDMRGNGGGYLTAAQEISSLWLNDKIIVQEKSGDKIVETLKSDKNPILGGVPTVVLVDGASASASEIVAGALKDNGAAKLVGVKTFGKGSVQEIVNLGDGSALKVTVAKWYTPGGKNISKEGIEPDVTVDLTESDIKSGNDTQKLKAFEMLK